MHALLEYTVLTVGEKRFEHVLSPRQSVAMCRSCPSQLYALTRPYLTLSQPSSQVVSLSTRTRSETKHEIERCEERIAARKRDGGSC
mmetsp:Transcript_3864/g.10637  ORF Transcript_3864/g.10637 Transcript_3864/m.10637 type:complete len:87 (-) Transcript_3864:19-279(-)